MNQPSHRLPSSRRQLKSPRSVNLQTPRCFSTRRFSFQALAAQKLGFALPEVANEQAFGRR